MSTPSYQQALGRKIAAERRRRGLSQPELARLLGRSVAWVSQVERGVRKIDRMSVLETVAAALEVPLHELAAEAPVVAAVTEEPPGAAGLRLVLSGAYALRAMLDGRRPPALSTLADQEPQGMGTDARGPLQRTDRSAARPRARPRNRCPCLARNAAGRGVRTDGRDLPILLSCAGQAR